MPAISLFEEKQVRRAWNASEEKWYFSIDDVILALTDSANVKDYIKKLRKRDPELDSYWGTNCPPVEMTAADGKQRMTDVADTEQPLCLIRSAPFPKGSFKPRDRFLGKLRTGLTAGNPRFVSRNDLLTPRGRQFGPLTDLFVPRPRRFAPRNCHFDACNGHFAPLIDRFGFRIPPFLLRNPLFAILP